METRQEMLANAERRLRARREPRWPAVIGGTVFAMLYYALPEPLTLGPGWVLPAISMSLVAVAQIAHRMRRELINEILAYVNLVLITIALASSLGLLIARLPLHKDPPTELLRSAGALWVANILLFASWYWRLDGGGPNARDKRGTHLDGAFFFPQMAMPVDLKKQMGEDRWTPGFVDYLFLAFNTSTAFSPTDVPVLSKWAKVLMMVQSMISLATIALLAARAVNIL